MRLIGVTGGIGAGKSKILSFIKEHYFCEIYLADEVAHTIKEPGQQCYQQLIKLLGKEILDKDNKINREKMAAKIFHNKDLLIQVNQIMHPAVRQYLLEKMEEARQNPKIELFFIEAALLIETGYQDVVDELWYIYADKELRCERLINDRGYTAEKVAKIMEQQLSEEAFRKACHFEINNSGLLEDSYQQIKRKLEAYTWRQ